MTGLRNMPKSAPIGDAIVLHHVDRIALGHRFDIGAGGEGFIAARYDHAANLLVSIESGEAR